MKSKVCIQFDISKLCTDLENIHVYVIFVVFCQYVEEHNILVRKADI